jgi:hypothetical protein
MAKKTEKTETESAAEKPKRARKKADDDGAAPATRAKAGGKAGGKAGAKGKAAADDGDAIELNEAAVQRLIANWRPVIVAVADAIHGDRVAASQLEKVFHHLEDAEDWEALPAVLRRILAGERDADALLDGLDVVESIIVHGVFAELASREAKANAVAFARAKVEQAAAAAAKAKAAAETKAAPAKAAAGKPAPAKPAPAKPAPAKAAAPAKGKAKAAADAPATPVEGVAKAEKPAKTRAAAQPTAEDLASLDEFLQLVVAACSPFGPKALRERMVEATAHMAGDTRAPAMARALGQALRSVLEGERDPDLSALLPVHAERVQRALERICATEAEEG